MRKPTKEEQAWAEYQQLVEDRYLASVAGPIDGDKLRTDLATLSILAASGDPEQQDAARDEAERALLRYIGDPEISQLFYAIRKHCA